MKRIKYLLTALLMLCCSMAQAYEFKSGGIYYNVIQSPYWGDNGRLEVTNGDEYYSGDIEIPEMVSYQGNWYTVTSIGSYAFQSCDEMTSITIPSTITTIEYDAFWDCDGLAMVQIPSSVTYIGSDAFGYCRNLETIIIPEGVTTIEYGAFQNCTSLTEINIPSSVTTISSSMFYNCEALEEIYIHNAITEIGNSAFSGCKALAEVIIPESVIRIGEYAFQNCTSLTEVNIPNSVTTISAYMFDGCEALKEMPIHNAITEIGNSAFRGCKALTEVVIPKNVTRLGENIFSQCLGLVSINVDSSNPKYDSRQNCNAIIDSETNELVAACSTTTIPQDIESIGSYAFSGVGLESIVVPATVSKIGSGAFSGCAELESITLPSGITSIESNTFNGCKVLDNVIIPDGVTSIGSYAFSDCSALTSITIPSSVTTISEYAFRNCSSLTNIVLPENVENLALNAFSGCTGLANLTIPEGTTHIVDNAFKGCTGLTSITIPSSVVSIGNSAFSGCTGLTSITIPEGVTQIGSSAFSGCTGLTSITIPEGVTRIEGWTFANCDSLSSITLPESVTSIGGYAFYNCKGLTSISLPETLTTIEYDAFRSCSSLASITLPESLTTIMYNTFLDCSSLSSITIPESVTSIGSSAFSGCKGLTSITLPENLTTIEYSAFYGCTGLASITIPEGVTKIGSSAFSGCEGLTSISLPETLTTIEYDAFRSCSSLSSITIPESVTSIGGYAFYGCKGLTSITLPENLTTIESYVFEGCSSLTSIIIPDKVTTIKERSFADCSALSRVTIGKRVTNICSDDDWYKSFNGCSNLKKVINYSNLGLYAGSYEYGYVSYYADNVFNVRDGEIVDNFFFRSTYSGSCLEGCIEDNGELILPQNYKGEKYYIGDNAFKNNKDLTNIVIPDCVTSIGSSAFSGCSSLSEITIGNAVTSIGDNTFDNCNLLKKLVIKDGTNVINLGYQYNGSYSYNTYGLFNDCPLEYLYLGRNVTSGSNSSYRPFKKPSLKTVVIGDGVTEIESSAFEGCSSLSDLTIGKGVTSIGNYAFSNCNALTSVIVPDSVKAIGSSAFSGCSSMSTLTIGNAVTSIGNNAFNNCSSLTSVLVPDSVKTIGTYAFSGCSSLSDLAIGKAVTSIGGYAFNNCSSLTSVVVPDSVETIGEYAFSNCSSLSDLTIGKAVTSIGNYALVACKSLSRLTIEDGDGTIKIGYQKEPSYPYTKNGIFQDCPLEYLYLGRNVTSATTETTYRPFRNHSIKTLVIGNKVTDIENYTFENTNLPDSIVMPKGVLNIGDYAFGKSSNLKRIEMESATPPAIAANTFGSVQFFVPEGAYGAYSEAEVWKDIFGSVMTKRDAFKSIDVTANTNKSSVLVALTDGDRDGEVVAPKVYYLKVKGTINSYDMIIFRNKMPNLRHLDLSEAVVEESNYPYYGTSTTKANDLGNNAFRDVSLQSIQLPAGLIRIGDYAFYNCTNLKNIALSDGVKSIGGYAFHSCSADVNIPSKVESIGYHAFDQSGIKVIDLPGTLTSLGTYAFYGCKSAQSIKIGNSLEKIPSNAFYNCEKVKEIIVGEKVKTIGENAFSDCDSLKTISFPVSLETIGSSAFSGCSSLETVSLPSSLRSIGSSAFSGCNNITGVYTHTVEPTEITESTFSVYSTATLYVPSVSYWTYYYGSSGWKNFLKLAKYDKPYEYLYSKGDNVFDEETGYPNGENGVNPDMDMDNNSGLVVDGKQEDNEDPNMNLGDVNVNHDGDKNSGSIIGDNNLHVDKLNIKIKVTGNKWYFFSFPFDVEIANISLKNGSHYVFRYYDGELRASGKSGWVNFTGNVLKAGKGYAFQCSASDELNVQILDIRFKKDDKLNEILAYISSNLKDASWNFMGNPFLSYYDINDMDYSAPITVWNGSSYVAVRPGDDNYHLAPTQAFFVQKPEGKENIRFQGDKQMTGKQSREKLAEANQSRMLVSESVEKNERLLINLVLSDDKSSDQTRVVFNENLSMGYETTCDAAKFDAEGVVQLYTLDATKVRYAINERPVDKGVVPVGFSVPAKGTYTIEAKRMDTPVFLKDNVTGVLHDLSQGAYTFSAEAGGSETRFQIVTKDTVTAIGEVDAEEDGETVIYDMSGRRVKKASHGVFVINGEKSVEK